MRLFKLPGTAMVAAGVFWAGGLSDGQAADMTPILLTGFNRDVVIESAASGPPYNEYAERLNPTESWAFYESGLADKSYGIPTGGGFVSALGDNTSFQLPSFTANNALVMSSDTGLAEGNLTLTNPETFSRIAILANSASGGGTAEVTLHFTDGSSFTTTYYAPDWFNNPDFALQGVERINLTTGATGGGSTNPRFYQTSLDLVALLGGSNKPIESVTLEKVATAGATAVYAISGEVAPPTAAVILVNPTNRTVMEAGTAWFSGVAGGTPVPSLSWLRNGVVIPGANSSTYFFQATLADHNAVYRLVASNVVGSVSYVVTSAPATLTVTADTVRPILLGAQSLGLTQVMARFSERVQPSTATNPANYSINGGITVATVSLEGSQSNIIVSVSPMLENALYTLTVNNVTDQSGAANTVTNNSRAQFYASSYANVPIGNPALAGSQLPVGNGWNISGGGGDIGGSSDQFQFSYKQRNGDFDVKVRLDSLTRADAWSEAGMVVRDSLAVGARSASVMATPSISGCYFQARGTTNGATTLTGSFPVNYPNTWLRLKRAGSDFTGYASIDGQNWAWLGTATLPLPTTVYFGFAVSSHNQATLSTAAFRDFGDVGSANVTSVLPFEPLGQSSRRTSLIISEIMYHPTNSLLEFVELFNTRGEPHDLSGYKLRGDADYEFPPGTIIPGGGFLVVAKSPVDLQTAYGLTGVLGPFLNNLPNDSGTVKLLNQSGGEFLRVDYSDNPPWPGAADGAGPSLVLARASYGENDPRAWAASDVVGGSPGRLDAFTPDPLRNVCINEFLAHTDEPEQDFIELYNHSTQAVDVGGCVLSDDPELDKYIIPGGTTIPANGFLSFNQTTLGFALSADGETIYFKNGARTRVIDVVRFRGQENGVSMGRWPDGSDQFYRLTATTAGNTNSAILNSSVVINELMYHPISENNEDQYIELYNRGGNPVDLSGWTLGDGVSFTFPDDTTIAANGYLVVANSRTTFLTDYPGVDPAIVFGNFGGNLSSNGERVTLAKPDSLINTNGAVVTTNFFHIVVDEVTYGDGGRWGRWADGGGSSLERIDVRANSRLPSNWADSDETTKAPWKLVTATGTVDNGNVSADQLQVLLLGAGECLIDNVEVLNNEVNLVANSTFESGAANWTAEGTESQSVWEGLEGFASGRSYRVRAVERGDNQVNRIRTPLTTSIPAGATNVTIRAQVRWLKGHPEILFRLRGNWLECAGEMALPISPGTPGAVNSRAAANTGPAITEVQHSPVLPAAGESFIVTARVQDPDGVPTLQLKYRPDPATGYFTVVMNDTGTAGDAVARDGIFTATVPGQTGGTMVAFYVTATDGFIPAATATFPSDVPTRECLVRVGELQPSGNFPAYRLWMTQSTQSTWASRHELDNSPFDVTFVLNNQRVIYNTKAIYAGSPYIAPGFSSPTAGRCGYGIDFPKDDCFLGDDVLVLDWPGGHGGETTALQEQMAYWIADKLNLPYSHRYTIRLHVNGVTDEARQAVFEAVHQPGSSFVEQWVPEDTDGQFFKVDRAFEFSDGGGLIADPQPRMQNYTTTGGVKKREKYRWWFMYRATDRVNDYDGIFAAVDALNAAAPEPYTATTLGLIDVDQWMRIFATEHIIVNFDSWGHEIGKNMYLYKPSRGKWQLYMFDLDWLMLVSAQTGRTPQTAALFNSEDPTISAMYSHPPFVRAYWRAVEDAINGPFDPADCNPVMDAKYQSLAANGVKWCDGKPLTNPTAVKSWFATRRTFLQNQLASVAAAFTVNPSSTTTNGVASISGTAPIGVATITINGEPWQVQWTGVNTWVATVPLVPGSNVFNVAGLDNKGVQVPGATGSVSVNYGGATPSAVDQVMINEIMAVPEVADAEYVELFNISSNYTFNLSGWELNGLSYVFPGGSFILPQSHLLLVKDHTAFHTAYGPGLSIFDAFGGNLQSDGETLSLLQRAGTNPPTVVDRIRYETVAPWPLLNKGTSLQLRDVSRDNSRVANWAAVNIDGSLPASVPILVYTNVWRYMQVSNLDGVNWTVPAYNDSGWPSGPGILAFENNSAITPLINTTLNDPRTAVNGMGSGHAYYFRTTVNLTNDLSAYTVTASVQIDDGAVIYVNGVEAYRLRMPASVTITNASLTEGGQQAPSGDAVSPEEFTLPSNLFGVGANTIAVSVHQNVSGSSDITFGFALDAELATNSYAAATPGTSNSVVAALPPFPTLWLNEVQALNQTGPMDNYGQRESWVEIYNPGPSAQNLSGYRLATNYANLAQWAFPGDAVVPAGGFLTIWCDGQTGQSVTGVPHTNFRLSSGDGAVALSRLISGTNQIVDYLTYRDLPANWSYGDVPDAQPFYRANMFFVTPGATNNAAAAPLNVFINEWMADNTQTVADAVDGGFEDWFELYNPGTNTVDIGGYFLTDNLGDPFQFEIPNNGHYLIPPGGYLLVWADNEAEQNTTNAQDLHVNFALSKGGESIGLFGSDGTQIDGITFGAQTSDISEGRFPNGAANVFAMPTPTPRAPNILPNTAPTLTPIMNAEVTLGQTLTFTAEASDADVPAQMLTFSLGAGAPAEATIGPVTGQFSWKPTAAPASVAFSVMVADDGTPSLTATQTFNVVVYLPPTITLQVNGDQMELSWPRGTLQEANEVAGPYVDVVAPSPLTVDLTETKKFYRIRL